MFDAYDRLRTYLMGLERVQAQPMGSEEGFSVRADTGNALFCTLSSGNPLRYRFRAQHLALPATFVLEPVRGWPGWVQVVNPCCQDEEALWQCLKSAYEQTVAISRGTPPQNAQSPSWLPGTPGGSHVAAKGA